MQTAMHAPLIVKLNPFGRDRIRLCERGKDLIPPTMGFQQTMPGFDVGVFIGGGVRNAFMDHPEGRTALRLRFGNKLRTIIGANDRGRLGPIGLAGLQGA